MINVLRHGDRRCIPWKNGGGTTAEVASAPADATLTDFTWRISIADVRHDGPFSEFTGADRIIVVIDGTALALSVDGIEHILKPMRPFAFSGDSVTIAHLVEGPTRDLNIMTRRTSATAALMVHVVDPRTNVDVTVNGDEEIVVLAASGFLTITDLDVQHDALRTNHPRLSAAEPVPTFLASLDAARRNGPAFLRLSGNGVALVIRFRDNMSPPRR
jgi:environmental stress-induced protein Ves